MQKFIKEYSKTAILTIIRNFETSLLKENGIHG